MEAGGKEEEEETLQMAFKKLRVDAESVPVGAVGGAVSVSEASRTAPRAGLENGGAKNKLCCPKDNWHGCMRKPSRGGARSQRRRRSKSPILHPPKFTYCSSASLSPPSGCLKHQRLTAPDLDPRPAGDRTASASATVPTEPRLGGVPEPLPPLVFGSCAGYETRIGGVISPPLSSREIPAALKPAEASASEEGGREEGACEGAAAPPRPDEPADFRALSERHSGGLAEGGGASCSCSQSSSSKSRDEGGAVAGAAAVAAPPRCRCRADQQSWNSVEVYSFTGLRDVISECENSLPSRRHASRTVGGGPTAASLSVPAAAAAALSSGSPRSCSEQARGYVDDITIEDLSGYMEYYLYIPKKMSHMAEMMYT